MIEERDDEELEKIRTEWMAKAEAVKSIEDVSLAIDQMTKYQHDYSTCVYAVASAALAAATYVSRQLGITGFQASCVVWDFIDGWGVFEKGPKKLLSYENMLYPQYGHKFDKVINEATWKWIQESAQKLIDDRHSGVHPAVLAHWQSIVAGNVPFGFTVKTEGEI